MPQPTTRLDFSQYRDPELVDAIGNAVTFPLFLARTLIRPVGLMLLLLLLAIITTDSAWFRGFLGFPGILLAVVNGVLLGLVLFVRRIRNDMKSVFAIASRLTVQVLHDLDRTKTQIIRGERRLPGLQEVFHEVGTQLVLPVLLRTLDRKIPLLGGLIASVTRRFFNLISARLEARIKKSEAPPPVAATARPEEIAAWLQGTERVVMALRDSSSNVVDKVGRVVAFPFLAVFSLVFLLSALLLYGAYAALG